MTFGAGLQERDAGTRERMVVFCIGAVQFVNILDFMIVMPLGPDFANALEIPLSHLGYIGGSYTAAACVSGLAGAFFLDRFDRRKALAVSLLGLVLGTLMGALARGLGSLIAARLIAGAFGGPATSVSYSIIADVIPPERRGKAMGAVMGAFSIASIFGVPAGLELSRLGGFRLPFIGVAALGAIIGAIAYVALPPMTAHLTSGRPRKSARDIVELVRLDTLLSLVLTFVVMCSGFMLIPALTPFALRNLAYPRERIGLLYLVGGLVSFVALRVVGRLVDRFGSARIATLGAIMMAGIQYASFISVPPLLPVMAIFVGFMFVSSFRNVAYNTLTTKVPRPDERARFSSLQSAVQHLGSALGAFFTTTMLVDLPDGTLGGFPRLATIALVGGLFVVPLMWTVERRVVGTPKPSVAGPKPT